MIVVQFFRADGLHLSESTKVLTEWNKLAARSNSNEEFVLNAIEEFVGKIL